MVDCYTNDNQPIKQLEGLTSLDSGKNRT